MFQKPLVKPAFHLSWFLLILGGISLLERGWWGIIGAAMLLFGLGVLAYTAFAIYLHRRFIKEPAMMLVVTMGFLLLLVCAHLVFGHWELAMILAVMSIPILAGWSRIRGQEHKPVSVKKKR